MIDRRDLEDIYPLSHDQEAFLLQSVQPHARDPGQLQMVARLRGALDPPAFQEAWQWATRRHPVLRTSIHWRQLQRPLQVVHRTVDMPVHRIGLEHLDEESRHRVVDAHLEADRARRLALDTVPNLRVSVLSLGAASHLLCWSCHHVLLDGWSAAIVLEEVLARYRGSLGARSHAPPPPTPYRQFVSWSRQQEVTESIRASWLAQLEVLGQGASRWRASGRGCSFDRVALGLSSALGAGVRQLAGRLQVPVSVVMQAAWAVVLMHLKGEAAIGFGISVSGRNAAVPGIESMVGLFSKVLPVSLEANPGQSFAAVVRELLQSNRRLREFEHLSASQLLAVGGAPGHALFDSLLVFENFPWDAAGAVDGDVLSLEALQGDVTVSCPLTLVVLPGERPHLQLHFLEELFSPDRARQILDIFEHVIRCGVRDPSLTLEALTRSAPKPVGAGRASARSRRDGRILSRTGMTPAGEPESHVAPRDPMELHLAKLWEDILGIENVGVKDNFFDLGGDSLLAVRLFDAIASALGKRLPLDALWIGGGTVEEIAAALTDGADAVDWPDLVEIKAGGGRLPVFCVHTMGGNLFHYYDLARHLHVEQPVYGLQARGVYGDKAPDCAMEALAASCIASMRVRQPVGPYRIVGFSSGGLVAFEMAHQLRAAGEDVSLLALLDTYVQDLPYAGRYGRQLRALLRSRSLRAFQEQLYFTVLNALGLGHRRRLLKAGEAHRWAYWSYLPRPYHAPVDLFLATEDEEPGLDAFRGWRGLVGGELRTHELPGSHGLMVKPPHVEALAGKLQAVLDATA